MTATVLFAPVQPNGVNSVDYTQVIVQVDARVVSAVRARRRVNGWLCLDVGDRVLAGEPELLIANPLCWRVPIDWTSPTTGTLAERVCDVLVDAVSGEILEPDKKRVEITHSVERAARTLSTPVA